MSETNDIARLRGVGVKLGRSEVLRGLELGLAPGELCVLLGRNGAGKTTLMRVLAGTLRAESGSVRVCGADPSRSAAARAAIGFVPSLPDLPPWMSLTTAARFARRCYPTWDDRRLWRAADALAVPRRGRISKLSRGQAAGVQLALALAARPRLLLLDEPFAGLDAVARDGLLSAFLTEVDLEDTATLVSTHDLDIAARIADRALLMDGGALREQAVGDAQLEHSAAALRALLTQTTPGPDGAAA
ncbi:ATP-binding cassette domain-containing protein [Engelhardtia mirabilis]|uniref:ABC transporter ATP-binding protein YtrB n=1 Tax=Engelhardtia mirabilis TaxID=2528011 RepID=A0A518BER4_9BACT|nr:ABC transporter ATP-binding protein YtrB [Planctomycetes bacterium Pla133]QDU99797.1 ABC transporter ATP-binding protein YtrB [Planctomycetes bacterium Pla86]